MHAPSRTGLPLHSGTGPIAFFDTDDSRRKHPGHEFKDKEGFLQRFPNSKPTFFFTREQSVSMRLRVMRSTTVNVKLHEQRTHARILRLFHSSHFPPGYPYEILKNQQPGETVSSIWNGQRDDCCHWLPSGYAIEQEEPGNSFDSGSERTFSSFALGIFPTSIPSEELTLNGQNEPKQWRSFFILLHVSALQLQCDVSDLGGCTLVPAHMPSSSSPTPRHCHFEIHVGGLGFAETLFSSFERLTEDAVQFIESCSCPAGCISCLGEKAGVKPDTRINALKLLPPGARVCTPIHMMNRQLVRITSPPSQGTMMNLKKRLERTLSARRDNLSLERRPISPLQNHEKAS